LDLTALVTGITLLNQSAQTHTHTFQQYLLCRSVAQRDDRPLSKYSNHGAASEHKATTRASARTEKDLTATRSSMSNLASANQSLTLGVQSKQAEIEQQTQLLHLRKKAADNR
jgi:conjugal transfer/entry exclusion protein